MKRVFLFVSILFFMVGFAAGARGADAPSGRTIKLSVIEKGSGVPLPKVPVTINLATGTMHSIATDEQGQASINIPALPEKYFALSVKPAGHVPTIVEWRDDQSIPAQYTIEIEKGTHIGGRVLDDAGNPIAGATVDLHVRGQAKKPHERQQVLKDPTTNADGTWSYDLAPADLVSASIGVHHPAYIAGGNLGYYPIEEVTDVAKLREGKYDTTLHRGVKLVGVVYDEQGKPISGAEVGLGADRVCSNLVPEVTTDATGRFSLAVEPRQLAVVTVKAKGHSPDLKQLTVADKPQELEFYLAAAHTLRGRIVDDNGKPIEGVYVFTDTWRGCRTLTTTLVTDAAGRFTWDAAPADAVYCDIYQTGYADNRHHPLTADGSEITIALHKPLTVSGRVVDAETGKPIDDFKVIDGISFGDDQPVHWQTRQWQKPHDGQRGEFKFELTYPYPGYAVRIEAKGYAPADSRIFKMDEHQVSLEFKLTKAQGFSGIVRSSSGEAAAGAKVVVATPGQGVYIRNSREIEDRGCETTTTDSAGKYSLPALSGNYEIVVIHDSGFAEITREEFTKSADVTLKPWARVEGMAMIGSKPAAGTEMAASPFDEIPYDPHRPRVIFDIKTTADNSGHFVFDRVRAGKVQVSRVVSISTANGAVNSYTDAVKVDAKPGETVHANVGGVGRPVIGRVAIPAEVLAMPQRQFDMGLLRTHVDFPKLEVPDTIKSASAEEKKKWYDDFMKSEKGRAYRAAVTKAQENTKYYPVAMNSNGSFRIDDVEAGTYDFSVNICQLIVAASSCGPGETVATASGSVTVPPIPGGRSDQPLDAGTFEMKIRKFVKVGDVAPDFAVKTIDGKDLKLADYRGKYVLLDFWATWCGPCVAEMPNLKNVYNSFGSNANFAMISLSLDPDTKDPKAFAEKNGIKWTQGFLGDWSKSSLPDTYGVNGIPSIFLIGPDGKVLAKDLRGEAIAAEVSNYLH